VSDVEAPGPLAILGLALLALPFLVLALRGADRRMPRRPASPHRWGVARSVAIVSTPLAAMIAVAPWVPEEPGTVVMLALSQVIVGAGALAALVLGLARPGGAGSLGLVEAPTPASVLFVPLVLFPAIVFFSFVLQLTWIPLLRAMNMEVDQEIVRLLMDLDPEELGRAALFAVGVAPVVEELLFRGFLLSALAGRLGERSALLWSSLIFSLLHGVASLPLLFVLSLFLGWLQLRTRCILVPILAHAFYNGFTFVLLALSQARG
jgi:membrane protease YdiL (CAAX protease family)